MDSYFLNKWNEVCALAEEGYKIDWRSLFDKYEELRCELKYKINEELVAESFQPTILFHRNINEKSQIYVEYDFPQDQKMQEEFKILEFKKEDQNSAAFVEKRMGAINKLKGGFKINKSEFPIRYLKLTAGEENKK